MWQTVGFLEEKFVYLGPRYLERNTDRDDWEPYSRRTGITVMIKYRYKE